MDIANLVHPAQPPLMQSEGRLQREKSSWRSILREPLFQFLLVGALLLFAERMLIEPGRDSDHDIAIGADESASLVESWSQRWGRSPNAGERAGLIEDHVREEVLYREALALGLDNDDTIIRRRLAQKMSFLLKSTGPVEEVTEGDLEAFVAQNPELFAEPATLDFHQVFFSSDMRSDPLGDAALALQDLRSGKSEQGVGDRSPLGNDFQKQSDIDISAKFGEGFPEPLKRADLGTWTGPIESAYGAHLIRVDARTAARTPPLEEIGQTALNLYLENQQKEAAEAAYRNVRNKYRIIIEENDGLGAD